MVPVAPKRMTHGDGAAIDVDLVVRRLPSFSMAKQHDGGEGLVDLEEVDVVKAPYRLRSSSLLGDRPPDRSA